MGYTLHHRMIYCENVVFLLWISAGASKEKIRTVVVENFPMLGKAAAWRFLEWVQENPKGSSCRSRVGRVA